MYDVISPGWSRQETNRDETESTAMNVMLLMVYLPPPFETCSLVLSLACSKVALKFAPYGL
jgi:hypothetical protein